VQLVYFLNVLWHLQRSAAEPARGEHLQGKSARGGVAPLHLHLHLQRGMGGGWAVLWCCGRQPCKGVVVNGPPLGLSLKRVIGSTAVVSITSSCHTQQL